MTGTEFNLRDLIRIIPDYPKPGVTFCDITTLLAAGPGRTAFARFWGLLAKEAAAHPSAFAAELMNEPVRQPRRHHHRHSRHRHRHR